MDRSSTKTPALCNTVMHTGKRQSRVIVLDKAVSAKMIGILIDNVYPVTNYNRNDIDQDVHSSNENHRDIIGVIRKHKEDKEGKDKSAFVIWPDIKRMIGREENEL
jgi:purine-binding chemotaxis protein CheW